MAFDWATVGQAVLSGGLQAAGSYLSANAAKDASKKAYKRALEFAQNGIQWKVADANAAGINPYFALGAPTATYSDSSVGVDPLGSSLDAMGQGISRAALANANPDSKMAAAMQPLALERAGLENDYLRAKIAAEMRLATQAGTPPGMPVPGGVGNIKVAVPGGGETAENHWGDFGGGLMGLGYMANDVARWSGGGPAIDATIKEAIAIKNALNRAQSFVVNYKY